MQSVCDSTEQETRHLQATVRLLREHLDAAVAEASRARESERRYAAEQIAQLQRTVRLLRAERSPHASAASGKSDPLPPATRNQSDRSGTTPVAAEWPRPWTARPSPPAANNPPADGEIASLKQTVRQMRRQFEAVLADAEARVRALQARHDHERGQLEAIIRTLRERLGSAVGSG